MTRETLEQYKLREELVGKAFQKIQSVMKNLGIDCNLTITYEGANPTCATLTIKSDRDDVPDVWETYYAED